MKTKTTYLSPRVRVVDTYPEEMICTSPVPGGNEDIGYEDLAYEAL